MQRAALEGGRIAMSFFKNNPDNWMKEGDSPVSEADLAVDNYLKSTLMGSRPDYGWLSEESEDDPVRLEKSRVFIVDPIDGTRAYLEQRTEWCLSLAVVENGLPVAGVIYAPAREELFTALKGQGAFLNGERIYVSDQEELKGTRIIGPIGYYSRPEAQAEGVIDIPYLRSLAYRFAMVACGRIDASVARARARDWDLAAVDLIISEAGGQLVSVEGHSLSYNNLSTKHPALVASPARLFKKLQRITKV
ncbi:3'(2'),5'-bisphosphate nucleotidase CysQ [Rhodobacteraceae bacterium RKSG542]|uniref:3'(2'),5'-bisphosphate nucleotidase CysQ n=1 Tax=Pseudovibrio flavus TaxID=2529854 RepID=UPI0012BB830F|nr:3'(2'),5'-bisphosphate nucleotidase CysQ [Pseudovibrio flavus]MTI18633.1 3'(2'),5'-bisphosphate nucleotidase CysQ [Pseudovibrio flavus]